MMKTMLKKSDDMNVHEYLAARRGLVLTMRGHPADALWVLVSQLKYHSEFPEDMIDDAQRIVTNEREKAKNQSEAEAK